MVALTGNPDGSSEVDYTVNPATGFPWATGPRNLAEPLNSVLPAWDVAMGTLATTGLLAAERRRGRTGEGTLVQLSLSDVAFAMVGNLGRIAEAQLGVARPAEGRQLPLRRVRPRLRDARRPARDGRRADAAPVDRAADATGIAEACASIEQATGHDLSTEAGRFGARDLIAALLRPWFAARDLADVRAAFAGTGVSWGPYQTFRQLVHGGPARSTANPMFSEVEQPGDRHLPHAGLAARLHGGAARRRSRRRRGSASTPRRSSPRCSGSTRPRSPACTTTGSSPAPAPPIPP